MCGRYQLGVPADWVDDLGLTEPAEDLPARYNIAPSEPIVAVRQDGRARRASLLRWGLVPPWAPDLSIGNRLLNARAETLTTKPAFREAFRQRRCLIPAHAFYEWRRVGKEKRPYRIADAGGRPFGFAGLWERWRGREGVVESCTIVTTTANERVAAIHGRMPAIVAPEQYGLWLDPAAPERALTELLRPWPADQVLVHPVSQRVNKAGIDDPECAREVAEEPEKKAPLQTSLW